MKRILLFTIFLTFIILNFTACNKSDNYITRSNLSLDTVVTITIYDTNDNKLLDDVFKILDDITNKFSVDLKESEITKINDLDKNIPLKISDDMKFVINKGLYYSELSSGIFDITIEPLVKLWSIGKEGEKIPTDNEIKDALKNINYKNISINENKIIKKSKDTKLDLGSIAKGYAADKIIEFLKNKGYKRAIINLGGNVYALGEKSKNTPWKIGIQNPFKKTGESLAYISVKDKTIVSSGINQRYFIKDNIRYHHILSPFTGYPIDNNLMSVSIITDSSTDADALSTITFEYGLNKGLKLIESLDGVEAIFITKDKKIYISDGLNKNFFLTDNEFKLNNK